MITYSWIEGWPAPFPDFSNKHRCRKLDKIRDWNVENKVSVQVTTMTRTAGSITVPTPL